MTLGTEMMGFGREGAGLGRRTWLWLLPVKSEVPLEDWPNRSEETVKASTQNQSGLEMAVIRV